jgi:hypothetical protein
MANIIERLSAENEALRAEMAERDALLAQAMELLRSARYGNADPGLNRSWAQRRRRWTDAVLDRAIDEGEGR